MPIPPLYGHEGIRNRLAGAIASGRLPQSLLLEGPRGVGKQRLALWLAQALVCEDRGKGKGEGCGACQHCKLVLSLSHPDVHWFVPVELSKKGADAGGRPSRQNRGSVRTARAWLEEPTRCGTTGCRRRGAPRQAPCNGGPGSR